MIELVRGGRKVRFRKERERLAWTKEVSYRNALKGSWVLDFISILIVTIISISCPSFHE